MKKKPLALPDVYLLVCRCTLDDVPVQLFRTLADAAAAVKKGVTVSNPLATWDESGFVGWEAVRFKNGRPFGGGTPLSGRKPRRSRAKKAAA